MLPVVWLQNHAGPLLFLPVSLLPDWSGVDVPDYRPVSADFRWNLEESRACDYDRACDVNDYVAAIPVSHGEGLVLNDEPCATAWLPREWGGLFARWEYAESTHAMEAALSVIPDTLDWERKGDIGIVASPQSLFNSAEPGTEPVTPRLKIGLAQGRYDIRWARFQPDASTAVGLIELRLAPG